MELAINNEPLDIECSVDAPEAPDLPLMQRFDGSRNGNSAEVVAPGLEEEAGLKLFSPRIHSTNMKTLALCRRRFLFAHRLGLVRKGFSRPLSMGSLYHRIMQSLYLGNHPSRVSESATEWIAKIIDTLAAECDSRGGLPGGSTLREVQDQAQSDLLKAQAMAFAIWDAHPLDSETWEVIAVEQPITIKIKIPLGVVPPLSMQIDLLLRHRASGEGWIVDHKTTSSSPAMRARMLSFDCQPRVYRFGATQAYPSMNIVGAIYSIIKKPSIKYCGKDASFEAYVDRVKQWYEDQRAKDPNNPPFVAAHIRFTEPVMPAELLGQLRETSRASRCAPTLVNFPKTPNTEQVCESRYGLCPYAELCTSNPGTWSVLIPSSFDQVDRDAAGGSEAWLKKRENSADNSE